MNGRIHGPTNLLVSLLTRTGLEVQEAVHDAVYNTGRHWHLAPEMLIVLEGSGKIEVDGDEEHVFQKGDLILIPAEVRHTFSCDTAARLLMASPSIAPSH